MRAQRASKPPDEPLLEFLEVMRRLRAECAWKAGQTHRSLARFLLEETHETLEAIDDGDRTGDWSHLREELGDLLLQVYFHAVIAEETGEFTLDDVARDITAKMHRRNPHVFAPTPDSPVEPAAIDELWQQIKATEKQRTSITDGLPPGLPALLYADKVLARLAREPAVEPVETAAPAPPVVEPVETPAPAHHADPAHHLGERLLALVAEARESDVDPEQALRDAVRRLLAPPP
ncbi:MULTISPECIES: MazG family protein [unclassified Nocardioides]|uniref:MazG family protein n=1 Tax=unclassified Nocardioides TaxID=2615069 RepID=UPI000057018A|nr:MULTISPECIES: MazG family protein [unclassified Nocardioides]ABL80449.1 MazG nucleotide pyrophosphohydrolase [Nocardioides sp. JS614]